MARKSCESGSQLLLRLGGRPEIGGLDPYLFPNRLQQGSIIELHGHEGSGKTELLLHLMIQCILPKTWQNLNINGLGIGVIFIDADYHLSLTRVASLLENHLQAVNKQSSTPIQLTDEVVDLFIKACLRRINVACVSDSTQLVVTVHSLDSLLINKPEVGVLMIDSVSAFYWIDRSFGSDGPYSQDVNQGHLVDAMKALVEAHKLVVFATKQLLFASRGEGDAESWGGSSSKTKMDVKQPPRDYMCRQWQQYVTDRWQLCRVNMAPTFNMAQSASTTTAQSPSTATAQSPSTPTAQSPSTATAQSARFSLSQHKHNREDTRTLKFDILEDGVQFRS